MEQYHPRAHVGKQRRATSGATKESAGRVGEEPSNPHAAQRVRYGDINRPANLKEVSVVRKAAEEAGLWRFLDAAEHGGFNI